MFPQNPEKGWGPKRAASSKRFEKEEKLAAERGADIEDLKERLQSLQTASRRFEEVASEAEQREKRSVVRAPATP